jgi:hypothetical protein
MCFLKSDCGAKIHRFCQVCSCVCDPVHGTVCSLLIGCSADSHVFASCTRSMSCSTNEGVATALETEARQVENHVAAAQATLDDFNKRVAGRAALAIEQHQQQQHKPKQEHAPVSHSKIKAMGALFGGVAPEILAEHDTRPPAKPRLPPLKDVDTGKDMTEDDIDSKRVELETEVFIEQKKFNKIKSKVSS